MSRNFAAVTPPTRPDGYDKRATREMPREASDNSAYEERIYQDSAKLAGTFTGTPQDTNLLGRVKDVRTVAQTVGHKISDYPGETPWFIKAVLTDTADQNRCLTLNLASGKNFKAVANPAGEYYNSLEYCNDGLTWNALPLNTNITPYQDTSVVTGFVFEYDENPLTALRDSSSDITRPTYIEIHWPNEETGENEVFSAFRDPDEDSSKEGTYMYAWNDGGDIYFTDVAPENVEEGTHVWVCEEEWIDVTEDEEWRFTINAPAFPSTPMKAWTGEDLGENSITVLTETVTPTLTSHLWIYDERNGWGDMTAMFNVVIEELLGLPTIWLRGRILHKGGVCPKFSGNTDAITKVEGSLADLLDYRSTSAVAPKYGAFAQMFQGSTALTDASGLVFPTATNPGNDIYPEMFDGCTALTAAPNLSQVTPSENSFFRMFRGCTALTTAPALPRVDVLPYRAYTSMFFGCSHLNSITVHIGTRIGGDALLDWMNGAGNAVDGQCTFYHSEDTFRWRYPSKSGIPGQDQTGQKEWTANPALKTKLFFSCEAGGSLTVSPSIQSGDDVTVGTAMTITPVPDSGFVFDSWISKPASSSVGTGGVLIFNMPYGRYDTAEDKVECVCRFRNNKNLSVNYRIENTSSDLAFVRCPEEDALRGGQWMFAWTPGDTNNTTLMTGIGILYTATLAPQAGSILYKQDASGNWFESAGTITSEVWTDNFTVIVFDNATSYSNSIKISVTGGSTYRNSYKSFCALTAPANASLTIDVYQSDGSTHVATADLHWSDNVTDNPRTVTVLAANKGICLSRDAN